MPPIFGFYLPTCKTSKEISKMYLEYIYNSACPPYLVKILKLRYFPQLLSNRVVVAPSSHSRLWMKYLQCLKTTQQKLSFFKNHSNNARPIIGQYVAWEKYFSFIIIL